MDTTLPFGLRFAPKIFIAVAEALEWIIQKGSLGRAHYLDDDYLTLGKKESDECARNLAIITTRGPSEARKCRMP